MLWVSPGHGLCCMKWICRLPLSQQDLTHGPPWPKEWMACPNLINRSSRCISFLHWDGKTLWQAKGTTKLVPMEAGVSWLCVSREHLCSIRQDLVEQMFCAPMGFPLGKCWEECATATYGFLSEHLVQGKPCTPTLQLCPQQGARASAGLTGRVVQAPDFPAAFMVYFLLTSKETQCRTELPQQECFWTHLDSLG